MNQPMTTGALQPTNQGRAHVAGRARGKPLRSRGWGALRRIERLIAEFEADRLDSAVVRHILGSRDPGLGLLRVSFLVERGELAQARAEIDAALDGGTAPPIIEFAAALLLFATHDYQAALDCLHRVIARSGPNARAARQLEIRMCLALGWEHDAREALERALDDAPGDARWLAWALRYFVRGRCWTRARAYGTRLLELAPNDASSAVELAQVHAALGERELAIAALQHALAHAPEERGTTYLRAAGRVAIEVGEFERARVWLGLALGLEPEQADVHVWLAEIATWSDRDQEARVHVERALGIEPRYGPGLRMWAVLELRRGRSSRARTLLLAAIELAPDDYQAHLWLAELDLRRGALDDARSALHESIARAPGYLPVAWMLRYQLILADPSVPAGDCAGHVQTEEFEEALAELAPNETARALETRRSADMLEAVEAGLAALRGNRSVHPTHLVDARLVRLRARTGCRHRSRWALQLLRVGGPELALTELAEAAARYPASSLPLCHRGELHLWLGNWREARADLERALDLVVGTRWAYLGLSTLDLLADDPEASLATNAHGVAIMRNTEEPAIHVFRGEAYRKCGDLERAIEELERGVAAHPSRVSAVVNLALAYAVKGERERGRRLWRRLVFEQACGLMSDAVRELGEGAPLSPRARQGRGAGEVVAKPSLRLVGDQGWEPPLADMVMILERALAMMGGNRSSGLPSYWTSDGRLRFVQQWPHGDRSPHSRDRAYLARARKLLVGAAVCREPRPHSSTAERVQRRR